MSLIFILFKQDVSSSCQSIILSPSGVQRCQQNLVYLSGFFFRALFTFSPIHITEECRPLVKFGCSSKILSLSRAILSSLFKMPSSMTRFTRLSILPRVKLRTKHSIVGLMLFLVKIAAIAVDVFIIFAKGSMEWILSANTSLKLTGATGSRRNQAKMAC